MRIWFHLIVLLFSLCFGWELTSGVTNISTLRSPLERVFSRRKRWLLFPKGTALKFTGQASKRLLAVYPRGLSFVLEAASYYPMPSARIDLIPKRFRKPTTKAPATKGPTAPFLIGIPGSLIKYRGKPAIRPSLVQRKDHNITDLRWVSHSKPDKWYQYTTQRPHWNKNQWWREKNQPKEYLQSHLSESDRWPRYGRDLELFDNVGEEKYFDDDLEHFNDSPHYHAHRTRRGLFSRLEDIKHVLGIDMKTCILRAMCDSKRFLLPPGYSMVQDIIRVVLTFPTINGLKDDYSRVMSEDYESCDAFLHHKCPLSLLEWFMNPKRSTL